MKTEKKFLLPALWALLPFLLLTSCSEMVLLSDSIMPQEIHHIKGFFVIYIILQISVLLFALLLGPILKDIGHEISVILHFIWIVWYRDYGFWNVLLLYALILFVSYRVFSRIRSKRTA